MTEAMPLCPTRGRGPTTEPSANGRAAVSKDQALRAVARLSEELRLRGLAARPSPGLWDRRRDVRPDRSSPPQESSQCGERPCGHFPRWPLPPYRPHSCRPARSEEHTSELQSLMRISYAVFCLKKK